MDLHLPMNQAIRRKIVVKSGKLSKNMSSELHLDITAGLIVKLETSLVKKQFLTSLIGTGKGSFATPFEVDEFISRARDSWSY